MTTRTAERVDGWESRPFDDGYDGLRGLADSSFSGVVTAGSASCCFLNGTVVGILDGDIDDFEDATGTVYTSPSPALPLLMVMQDRQGEARAKYYSEETPLSEADQKLSEGGFTGFVELSENVLSGDYYVVYHGGESMSVAFVGQSEQLLTGDEAFQQADDEVGIYQVYPVDIDPVDIPEPEEPDTEPTPDAGTDASAGGVADTGSDDGSGNTTASGTQDPAAWAEEVESVGTERRADDRESDSPGTTERSTGGTERSTGTSADAGSAAETEPTERERDDRDTAPERETSRTDRSGEATPPSGREEPSSGDRGRRDQSRSDRREESGRRDRDTGREPGRDRDTGREPGRDRDDTDDSGGRSATSGRVETDDRGPDTREPAEPSGGAAGGTTGSSGRREAEANGDVGGTSRSDDPLAADPDPEAEPTGVEEPAELERRTIPSLDPGRTRTAGGQSRSVGGAEQGAAGGGVADDGPASGARDRTGPDWEASGGSGASGRDALGRSDQRGPEAGESAAGADIVSELREREAEVEDLEAEVTRLEEERDDLSAEVTRLEEERDDLAADLRSVREERDRLRTQVEQLRSRVAELEAEDEDPADADIKLTPADAIDQTDLRVRYDSKGDATLAAAHAEEASRDEVASNLTLGYHTLFDDTNAAVEDEPFRSFLEGTLQYRFVEWLIYDLLYEIQKTGNESALRDLYDAIPRVHEVQLDHSIRVTDEESAVFDMAFYDVDGNLLAVANVNDNRSKVGESMVSDLLTAASRVRETHSAMVGAFLVTASVFNAEARKIPKEESGGGLLSRDSRESYISVSRSNGFHLCLVEEDDEENFHLDVPEL